MNTNSATSPSYVLPIALTTVGVITGLTSLIVTVSAIAIALAAIGGAFALIGIGTALFIKFYFNKKITQPAFIEPTRPVITGIAETSTPNKIKVYTPPHLRSPDPSISLSTRPSTPAIASRTATLQQPVVVQRRPSAPKRAAPPRPVIPTATVHSALNTERVAPKSIHRGLMVEDPLLANDRHQKYSLTLKGASITIYANPKEKVAILLTQVNKQRSASDKLTVLNTFLILNDYTRLSFESELGKYNIKDDILLLERTLGPSNKQMADMGYTPIDDKKYLLEPYFLTPAINTIFEEILHNKNPIDLAETVRVTDMIVKRIEAIKIYMENPESNPELQEELRQPALKSAIGPAEKALTIFRTEIQIAQDEIALVTPLVYNATTFPSVVVNVIATYGRAT